MRRLFDKGKIRLEEYAQSIASRWRSDLFIGHVGVVRDAPAPGGGPKRWLTRERKGSPQIL
jgi:hypothetical protein